MYTELPYCLVLGGGGAKGVYHIGVWRALKEMNIPINAFIGNSIGAVVSAFLVQKADDKLLDIAQSMTIDSLIRLNDKTTEDGESEKHDLKYWQSVYENVVENKGLDTTPLRRTLETHLDEGTLRNSGVDFGITTVNVSDFKAREVFIDEMEENQIISYIMASAAFPGFNSPKIKGKKYVDGGLHDNVPFSMARKRGYRKIILVDVSGMGVNRRPKTDGTQTVYIKNSIEMGGIFDFNPTFIEAFIELGYLDTLRTFGQLIGYDYFIELDPAAEAKWKSAKDLLSRYAKLYPKEMKHDKRWRLKTLEVCATLLNIDRIQKHSYDSLQAEIDKELESTRSAVNEVLGTVELDEQVLSRKKVIDGFLKAIFSSDKRDQNPYYYLCLLKNIEPNAATALAETTLRKWSPELDILESYIAYTDKMTDKES